MYVVIYTVVVLIFRFRLDNNVEHLLTFPFTVPTFTATQANIIIMIRYYYDPLLL